MMRRIRGKNSSLESASIYSMIRLAGPRTPNLIPFKPSDDPYECVRQLQSSGSVHRSPCELLVRAIQCFIHSRCKVNLNYYHTMYTVPGQKLSIMSPARRILELRQIHRDLYGMGDGLANAAVHAARHWTPNTLASQQRTAMAFHKATVVDRVQLITTNATDDLVVAHLRDHLPVATTPPQSITSIKLCHLIVYNLPPFTLKSSAVSKKRRLDEINARFHELDTLASTHSADLSEHWGALLKMETDLHNRTFVAAEQRMFDNLPKRDVTSVATSELCKFSDDTEWSSDSEPEPLPKRTASAKAKAVPRAARKRTKQPGTSDSEFNTDNSSPQLRKRGGNASSSSDFVPVPVINRPQRKRGRS